MFFANLAPQLVSLDTEPLRVLLECHKLITPQVRLSHQEVQAAGKSADLRFKVIPGIDKCGSTLADGELDVLFRGSELRKTADGTEGRQTLEEGRFLELKR